jgi:hypothetical protein
MGRAALIDRSPDRLWRWAFDLRNASGVTARPTAVGLATLLSACTPFALRAGAGTGIGHAHLAGTYRDVTIASAGGSVAVGTRVAVDVDATEDVDRIESSLGAGVRVRLRPCWAPYLRGHVAVVDASYLASDLDVLAGAGHWGHLASHVAWFAELDAIARIGEPNTVALRLELGLAFETAAFWR